MPRKYPRRTSIEPKPEGALEYYEDGRAKTRYRKLKVDPNASPEAQVKAMKMGFSLMPSYFPFNEKPYLQNEKEVLEAYLQNRLNVLEVKRPDGKPLILADLILGFIVPDGACIALYLEWKLEESDSVEVIAARLLEFIYQVNDETDIGKMLDLAYKFGRNWEVFCHYKKDQPNKKNNGRQPKKSCLSAYYEKYAKHSLTDEGKLVREYWEDLKNDLENDDLYVHEDVTIKTIRGNASTPTDGSSYEYVDAEKPITFLAFKKQLGEVKRRIKNKRGGSG